MHDSTLRREGLDLHLDVPVTLLELYRGGSIEVSTQRGVRAVQIPAAEDAELLRALERLQGATRARG